MVNRRPRPLRGWCRAALLAAALGCSGAPRVRTAVVEARGGATVLRYDGAADAVYLRGTMTDWEPLPLRRAASGFALAVTLSPGRYEYHLEIHRAGMIEIVVPVGAERTADGFGGENAILRVP